MKKLLLAGAAAAVVALGAPAQATDLPPMATPSARAPAAMPAPLWQGFYAGLSLGGRWATVDGVTTGVGLTFPLGAPTLPNAASYDSATFRVGGYAGYNWQLDPRWVLGVEGDFAWGDGSATRSFIPGINPPGAGDSTSFTHTWDAGVRARVGYLINPTWMIYLTGGYQWQHVEASLTCGTVSCPTVVLGAITVGGVIVQTNSKILGGWTIGGGAETLLRDNWVVRGEYRYADYGTWSTAFGGFPKITIAMDFDVRTHTALLGVGKKF